MLFLFFCSSELSKESQNGQIDFHKLLEEAKNKYEASLATNEKDFGDEDLHDVAMVYYKTKNEEKSILFFNKAISLNPNNVEYYNNLAAVYMDLKNWQKVKENAQQQIDSLQEQSSWISGTLNTFVVDKILIDSDGVHATVLANGFIDLI